MALRNKNRVPTETLIADRFWRDPAFHSTNKDVGSSVSIIVDQGSLGGGAPVGFVFQEANQAIVTQGFGEVINVGAGEGDEGVEDKGNVFDENRLFQFSVTGSGLGQGNLFRIKRLDLIDLQGSGYDFNPKNLAGFFEFARVGGCKIKSFHG